MQITKAMTRARRRRMRHVRAPLRRNIDEPFEHDEREIIIGGDDKAGEP